MTEPAPPVPAEPPSGTSSPSGQIPPPSPPSPARSPAQASQEDDHALTDWLAAVDESHAGPPPGARRPLLPAAPPDQTPPPARAPAEPDEPALASPPAPASPPLPPEHPRRIRPSLLIGTAMVAAAVVTLVTLGLSSGHHPAALGARDHAPASPAATAGLVAGAGTALPQPSGQPQALGSSLPAGSGGTHPTARHQNPARTISGHRPTPGSPSAPGSTRPAKNRPPKNRPAKSATPSPAPAKSAKPVSSTVSAAGHVTCLSGRAVEGIWIAGRKGGSGWATWTAATDTPSHARFHRTIPRAAYEVHVGCGGSPSSWQVATYSTWATPGTHAFTCDDISGQPRYGECWLS